MPAPALTPVCISELLQPFVSVSTELCAQLSTYLDLLLHWNARTNLTAIRSPEEIVRRHFGESLFAAQHLFENINPATSLLDFGSGAGFPGLPIQLFHRHLAVTLAESQQKKAAFLREVIRALHLPTEVWPHRVESMPPTRRFDIVTLRAVDRMPEALASAALRTRRLVLLSTTLHPPTLPAGFHLTASYPVPNSSAQQLLLADATDTCS